MWRVGQTELIKRRCGCLMDRQCRGSGSGPLHLSTKPKSLRRKSLLKLRLESWVYLHLHLLCRADRGELLIWKRRNMLRVAELCWDSTRNWSRPHKEIVMIANIVCGGPIIGMRGTGKACTRISTIAVVIHVCVETA